MKFRFLLSLALFLLLFGCINLGEPSKPMSKSGGELPYLSPTIKILSPDGLIKTTDDSADVPVFIEYANLILKSPGGSRVPGEGHFQITLAGRDPVKTNSSSYTFENLPPGEYFLRVELFNNDYTPYTPKILSVSNFKIIKTEALLSEKTHEVQIKKFLFEPKELVIRKGDTVKWENTGTAPVTITSSTGVFSSLVYPSGVYSFKFTKEGIYEYSNSLYPSMSGKIVVKN